MAASGSALGGFLLAEQSCLRFDLVPPHAIRFNMFLSENGALLLISHILPALSFARRGAIPTVRTEPTVVSFPRQHQSFTIPTVCAISPQFFRLKRARRRNGEEKSPEELELRFSFRRRSYSMQ